MTCALVPYSIERPLTHTFPRGTIHASTIYSPTLTILYSLFLSGRHSFCHLLFSKVLQHICHEVAGRGHSPNSIHSSYVCLCVCRLYFITIHTMVSVKIVTPWKFSIRELWRLWLKETVLQSFPTTLARNLRHLWKVQISVWKKSKSGKRELFI